MNFVAGDLVSFVENLKLQDGKDIWLVGGAAIAKPCLDNNLFDHATIKNFVCCAVDPQQLRNGIELWITVFPSLNIPRFRYDPAMLLIDMIRAKMGQDTYWLHVRSANTDRQIYDILLASAAIPLAFPQREINGNIYVDGGFADNVPLGVLADQGCTHVIVIHLENGAIWNRHQFPNQTVIEVRPNEPINKSDIPLYSDAIVMRLLFLILVAIELSY